MDLVGSVSHVQSELRQVLGCADKPEVELVRVGCGQVCLLGYSNGC